MQRKAILFDLGNVLVDLDIDRNKALLYQLLGRNYDLFDEDNTSIFLQYQNGKISEWAFLKTLKERSINTSLSQEEIKDIWNSILVGVQKETLELIEKLKQTYQLYVYSNTNKTHIDWLNNYLNSEYGLTAWFESNFEEVFFSHDIGFSKPAAEGYQLIAKRIKEDTSKIVFIDDHLPNVTTAIQCGFQGIHKPANIKLYDALKSHKLI